VPPQRFDALRSSEVVKISANVENRDTTTSGLARAPAASDRMPSARIERGEDES